MALRVPPAFACNNLCSDLQIIELQAGGNDNCVLLKILPTEFHIEPNLFGSIANAAHNKYHYNYPLNIQNKYQNLHLTNPKTKVKN